MNIVVVDDDNLVALSLKTILEASEDLKVAAIGTTVFINIFLAPMNFVFRKTLFNFVAEICFQSGSPVLILRAA